MTRQQKRNGKKAAPGKSKHGLSDHATGRPTARAEQLRLASEKLITKRKELLDSLERKDVRPELGGRDDGDRNHFNYETELFASLNDQKRMQLRFIDSALERIAKGTYGYCESCGGKIPPCRLDAIPWAVYCIPCTEGVRNPEDQEEDDPRHNERQAD